MILRPTTLKKIRKLDPEELLFWVSACQLPKVVAVWKKKRLKFS